jgi:hypothetical protein
MVPRSRRPQNFIIIALFLTPFLTYGKDAAKTHLKNAMCILDDGYYRRMMQLSVIQQKKGPIPDEA